MLYTFTENTASIRCIAPGSQYHPSTVVEPSIEADCKNPAIIENRQIIIINTDYINYL